MDKYYIIDLTRSTITHIQKGNWPTSILTTKVTLS